MKKHTFGDWMFAVRPWSFPASAMPIIVTLTYVFYTGTPLNWGVGIWVLITMILFHAAGNTWSDYHDYMKQVDREDTYGAKSITEGMFMPKEIKNLSLFLFATAIISGLGIATVCGPVILWCGIAGAILTILYPFFKYNALGDLVILLTFAFIPVIGTSYAVTGAIDWNTLLVALPVGLITDGILHSNNTRDISSDKRANITTMAMSLGTKASAGLYVAEMLFPYIWIGICSMIGLMPIHTVVIFLTLPIAIACAKTMSNSVKGGAHMIADLDVRTATLQMQFSILLSAAFVVARLL